MRVVPFSVSRRCGLLSVFVVVALVATPLSVWAAGATGQTQDSGSASGDNACIATYLPAVQEPTPASVGVDVATDAFPEPHLGDVITLFDTQLTVTIPPEVMQPGVDAGVINDGTAIPMQMTLGITGSNTSEGTQSASAGVTAIAHVINGVAQSVSGTVDLPNSTWHPVVAWMPVSFTEQALNIAFGVGAPLGLTATVTLDCTPTNPPPTISRV